jgi:hypothetical protein
VAEADLDRGGRRLWLLIRPVGLDRRATKGEAFTDGYAQPEGRGARKPGKPTRQRHRHPERLSKDTYKMYYVNEARWKNVENFFPISVSIGLSARPCFAYGALFKQMLSYGDSQRARALRLDE